MTNCDEVYGILRVKMIQIGLHVYIEWIYVSHIYSSRSYTAAVHAWYSYHVPYTTVVHAWYIMFHIQQHDISCSIYSSSSCMIYVPYTATCAMPLHTEEAMHCCMQSSSASIWPVLHPYTCPWRLNMESFKYSRAGSLKKEDTVVPWMATANCTAGNGTTIRMMTT